MDFAGLDQGIEDGTEICDWNMQFPAEFADIGDPQRPEPNAGDCDLADMAEGEGGIRDIVFGHGFKHGRVPSVPSGTRCPSPR